MTVVRFTRDVCGPILMILWAAAISGMVLAADEIHWTVTGQTSITLDWRGPESTVHYGLTSAYGLTAAAVTPNPLPFSSSGPFWEATLTGLQENTAYHYSIGSGPDHVFRTPPPHGGACFTACVEGDVGDSVTFPEVATNQSLIASLGPTLTFVVGDLTYADHHGQAAVDQHFNDVMVWSQDAAYMPAWGNADWDIPAADDLRNYKGRFAFANPQTTVGAPAPGCCGEDWYWFDYGNIRFIAYPDPYTGSAAWSDWNTQATALMDQAQADPGIRYIVTLGHRPAYSSGHHPGDPELAGYLDALACGHSKYVLNLNGHSHGYERTYPQAGSACATGAPGAVHLTVGTGGSDLEQDGSCLWAVPCGGACPCAPPAWSAFRAMHLGAGKLRFTPTGIEGFFICGPPGGGTNDVSCAEGSIVDHFTIGSVLNVDNLCNGLDDDCDGMVDEDYVPVPTTCGTGACRGNAGTLACSNGTVVDTCNPLAGATAEMCDGIDNNCNGTVDDGFNLGSSCVLNYASCQVTGRQVCALDKTTSACDTNLVQLALISGTQGTNLSWSAVSPSPGYDVVRGSLNLLETSAGNFTLATGRCLANDQAATGLEDRDVPAIGSGFWYLVRGNHCGNGSYDAIDQTQIGLRNTEVNASSNSCP